jgi:hypothetical protein
VTIICLAYISNILEVPSTIAVREKKGRENINDPDRVLTINEKDWHKLQQKTVLESVSKAFDGGSLIENGTEDDGGAEDEDSGCAEEYKATKLSDGAEELAVMIQDQIESINRELRYITRKIFCMLHVRNTRSKLINIHLVGLYSNFYIFDAFLKRQARKQT